METVQSCHSVVYLKCQKHDRMGETASLLAQVPAFTNHRCGGNPHEHQRVRCRACRPSQLPSASFLREQCTSTVPPEGRALQREGLLTLRSDWAVGRLRPTSMATPCSTMWSKSSGS